MAPRKKPLKIRYCKSADQELKDSVIEAERLLQEKKISLPVSKPEMDAADFDGEKARERALRNTAGSLADMALNPERLYPEAFDGETLENFRRMYARRPDATLEILARLRKLASDRQRGELERLRKKEQTYSGRVRKFMVSNSHVIKRRGQLILAEKLTAKDFLPDRKTLKPGIEYVPVSQLQHKEIAGILGKGVTEDSVRKALKALR
jgi:hypothetical protein